LLLICNAILAEKETKKKKKSKRNISGYAVGYTKNRNASPIESLDEEKLSLKQSEYIEEKIASPNSPEVSELESEVFDKENKSERKQKKRDVIVIPSRFESIIGENY